MLLSNTIPKLVGAHTLFDPSGNNLLVIPKVNDKAFNCYSIQSPFNPSQCCLYVRALLHNANGIQECFVVPPKHLFLEYLKSICTQDKAYVYLDMVTSDNNSTTIEYVLSESLESDSQRYSSVFNSKISFKSRLPEPESVHALGKAIFIETLVQTAEELDKACSLNLVETFKHKCLN